eukprot:8962125-Alexandrium_andersonii.AAC.1
MLPDSPPWLARNTYLKTQLAWSSKAQHRARNRHGARAIRGGCSAPTDRRTPCRMKGSQGMRAITRTHRTAHRAHTHALT